MKRFCLPPRLLPPFGAAAPVLWGLVLLAALAGCAKPPLPGYGPGARAGAPAPAASPPAASASPGAAAETAAIPALPEGWGFVDVTCRQGQNSGRGVPDTLFGCLLHAREGARGTVLLPRGVYLGHVAGFIAQALKYYHVEDNFQEIYDCRIVLLFRPATRQEREDARTGKLGRLGLGVAGEVALTVVAGAPLIPIVAPLTFVFESVSEDLRFQEFRRHAARSGLPAPSRRGDEIVAGEYARRYAEYWAALGGGADGADGADEVPDLYVVQHCSLQGAGGPPLTLVSGPGGPWGGGE